MPRNADGMFRGSEVPSRGCRQIRKKNLEYWDTHVTSVVFRFNSNLNPLKQKNRVTNMLKWDGMGQ